MFYSYQRKSQWFLKQDSLETFALWRDGIILGKGISASSIELLLREKFQIHLKFFALLADKEYVA